MGRVSNFVRFVIEWCEDDSHGYSQINRWGPDCDCASLIYMSARSAGYSVPNSGTRYTGTLREHFAAAGFAVERFNGSFSQYKAGAVFLAEGKHVELYLGNGMFGGARIDEHGSIEGCCSGDQTGNEVSVVSVYLPSYGWDYVLIPPDDDDSNTVDASIALPRYRVKTQGKGWLPWLEGLECLDGCGDDFAGIVGDPIIDVAIDWRDGDGWYSLRTASNPNGLPKDSPGDGSPVVGVTCYYRTMNPDTTGYYQAKYRVSTIGNDYLKWEYDDCDEYAGDGENPIDRFQLTLCAL